jgi:hypothetical protein
MLFSNSCSVDTLHGYAACTVHGYAWTCSRDMQHAISMDTHGHAAWTFMAMQHEHACTTMQHEHTCTTMQHEHADWKYMGMQHGHATCTYCTCNRYILFSTCNVYIPYMQYRVITFRRNDVDILIAMYTKPPVFPSQRFDFILKGAQYVHEHGATDILCYFPEVHEHPLCLSLMYRTKNCRVHSRVRHYGGSPAVYTGCSLLHAGCRVRKHRAQWIINPHIHLPC